jgi:hypothetical protein
MIYQGSEDWLNASHKRVLLFGMSGLGKTHVSNMLRTSGDWFHYSVDYRIGTRYMGELIADSFKRKAMHVPYLRQLLMSDSIYIASNITFDNLSPLSTYLGKPGDEDKGGLGFNEYMQRQEEHRSAEIAALLDTPHFIKRAEEIYQYEHFVCDSGGSICEVLDPGNPDDPVLQCLAQNTLLVWIEGNEAHRNDLVERFDCVPKPMYYQPQFLKQKWSDYLENMDGDEATVDPDDFVRWTYSKALEHRQPRYAEISKWGVTVSADEVGALKTVSDFELLIATALERKDK